MRKIITIILLIISLNSKATVYYFRNTGTTTWATATNWSLTDGGGATGAIPTASDDAYFSNLSGNCQLNGTVTCKSLDFSRGTGYTGTLSGTVNVTVAGNITFSTSMTITATGNLAPSTSCNLNFAGKTWPNTLNLPSGTTTITIVSDISAGTVQFNGNTTFSGSYNIYCANCIANQVASLTYSLSGGMYITNSFTAVNAFSGQNMTFKSTVPGTKRVIRVSNNATMDLGPVLNFTDIDASGGLPIYTFRGTISNCTNVFNLTSSLFPFSTGFYITNQ